MPYYPHPPEEKGRKPAGQRRPLIRWIGLGLSVLLLGYGAFRLILYGAEWASSRQTTEELRRAGREESVPGDIGTDAAAGQEVMLPMPEDPAEKEKARAAVQPGETGAEAAGQAADGTAAAGGRLPEKPYPHGLQVNAHIQKLRKKSELIFGWITMDDLDEPVGLKDNSFFLDHDVTGRTNSNGALFLNEDTKLLTRPYTLIVYGHNMKTGAMFGNLRKYEKNSYYVQHRLLSFETLYDEGRYAIFSVARIRLTPGTSRYYSLYALESMDRETRRNAVSALAKMSMHGAIVDVNEEDQLLLLVTCTGDDDERLVVAARRLREGEREDALQLRSVSGR